MTGEREPVLQCKKEEFDLSPLAEMLGVRRALSELKGIGVEEIGQVLRKEQASYAALTRFEKRAEDLKEIIGWFDEGKIGVGQILEAAGVETRVRTKEEARRGVLGRIFGKRGRR